MEERKLTEDCHYLFYYLNPVLVDDEENGFTEKKFFEIFKNKNTKEFQRLCIKFKTIFSRDLFLLFEKMENKELFNKIIFYIGLNSMPIYKRLFFKLYLLITNKKPYKDYGSNKKTI